MPTEVVVDVRRQEKLRKNNIWPTKVTKFGVCGYATPGQIGKKNNIWPKTVTKFSVPGKKIGEKITSGHKR